MSSHLMAPQEEQDSLEQCVTNFIAAKTGIKLDNSEVSACHTNHGKKNTPDIIVKFINRKTKVILLKKSRMLKGTGVYINEHLTQKNALIAKEARKLRREKKILLTWTRNCRVFIRTLGSPQSSQIKVIHSIEELDNFT